MIKAGDSFVEPQSIAGQDSPLESMENGDTWYKPVGASLGHPIPNSEPLTLTKAPLCIEDRYIYKRALGSGGMGQVHLYVDTELNRHVAIKFLRRQVNEELYARFGLEGRAAAQLRSSHIVAIYDVGSVDGQPFLISEYVEGKPLSDMPMPMEWQDVLRIGIELTQALQEAHGKGILHRDIKPSNVLVDRRGAVKLCDFGLAKWDDRADLALDSGEGLPLDWPPGKTTIAGARLGTPLYMSPEAWRGEEATTRSDIYSLGVLLYELASGHVPNLDTSALFSIPTGETHTPLHLVNPRVPRRLCELIERCMQPDPQIRFGSATELLAALLSVQQKERQSHLQRRIGIGMVALAIISLLAVFASQILRRWLNDRMVFIKGGIFTMGSTREDVRAGYDWCKSELRRDDCHLETYEREMPTRKMQVTSFYLDRTEVRAAHYAGWLNQVQGASLVDDPDPKNFMKRRFVEIAAIRIVDLHQGSPSSPGSPIEYVEGHGFRVRSGAKDKPMVQVTWEGARRYCVAHGKRLPSETEWEYAARGPQGRPFPFGFEPPGCSDVVFGRYLGLACALRPFGPADVGTTQGDQSATGIFDLAGNVMEWTQSRFVAQHPPCAGVCSEPLLQEEGGVGGTRVVRGGSWALPASDTRASARSRLDPQRNYPDVGFRCASAVLQ